MGTGDASDSFLKAATARGRAAPRRRRGKRKVVTEEKEAAAAGAERGGEARRREAVVDAMDRCCRSADGDAVPRSERGLHRRKLAVDARLKKEEVGSESYVGFGPYRTRPTHSLARGFFYIYFIAILQKYMIRHKFCKNIHLPPWTTALRP
jgi:hypothetical protein